ncbi:MAG: serine protease [Synergistaceae bacterium]|nr:serine protease [Synergistaceae bacterium]
MTPEEACLYLGISPDDEDLDIDRIERNYKTKLSIYDPRRFNPDTPEYGEARRMRRNIEEAYTYLTEAYEELYGTESEEYVPQNTHTLLKITAITTTIAALCLAGFIWLAYPAADDGKPAQITEAVYSQNYEKLLREVERLRAATEAPRTQVPPANIPPTDYADLVEQVMPSMVMIQTDAGSAGSGFFVSDQGDILTNWHVIRGAGRITVTPQNGMQTIALVKDYDRTKDVALLKVNTSKASPFLRISAALPRQGEAVMAIGNPRGYEGTVSNGIISAFRENNTIIQFTAPISQGSSGGALINLKGEVVGMPTKLRTDGQNLNFAIAPAVLAQFFDGAKRKPAKSLTNGSAGGYEKYGLKLVRSDESYEMYLETGNIDYDPESSIASFVSVWLPTERTNAKMKRDPNFHAVRGKNFGPCMLVYIADMSEGTYIHLRTVNLYTDGTTARDYVRPERECKWEKPSRGSRADELLQEVRRQLRL